MQAIEWDYLMGSLVPFGGPFSNLGYFKQFLRIFEGIFEDIWRYLSKKYWKNQVREKIKKWARSQIIMVGKLNYMENDAELDGQWSIQMVKVWFYKE